MLTKNQQKLLIMMLSREVTKKDNRLYTSKAFYRSVKYLEDNHLVRKKRLENNMNEVSLTLKGILFARLLASFNEINEKIKEKYGLD